MTQGSSARISLADFVKAAAVKQEQVESNFTESEPLGPHMLQVWNVIFPLTHGLTEETALFEIVVPQIGEPQNTVTIRSNNGELLMLTPTRDKSSTRLETNRGFSDSYIATLAPERERLVADILKWTVAVTPENIRDKLFALIEEVQAYIAEAQQEEGADPADALTNLPIYLAERAQDYRASAPHQSWADPADAPMRLPAHSMPVCRKA